MRDVHALHELPLLSADQRVCCDWLNLGGVILLAAVAATCRRLHLAEAIFLLRRRHAFEELFYAPFIFTSDQTCVMRIIAD